jgi:uncharacterized membrane protein YraQ (UPF0718 family)
MLIGNYYYFYCAIAAVVIAIIIAYSFVLIFAAESGYRHQSASAINKPKYNSTSTICINDKPCVTTICINNDPCHTVTSNSTNTDNLTNNDKKHTLVSPFPQQSV